MTVKNFASQLISGFISELEGLSSNAKYLKNGELSSFNAGILTTGF